MYRPKAFLVFLGLFFSLELPVDYLAVVVFPVRGRKRTKKFGEKSKFKMGHSFPKLPIKVFITQFDAYCSPASRVFENNCGASYHNFDFATLSKRW